MEVGGFAIGAVALVSLVKDCTDLYSMFVSAQELGRDSSSLKIKLDIERNRFFTWSERVDLLHQDRNGLIFRNTRTQDLVMQVLKIIRDLLSDGSRLEIMYGLQSVEPVKQSDLTVAPKRRLESASDFQLSQFIRDLRKMRIKGKFSSSRSLKLNNIAKQISWVIIDKEKFNKLILDLSYYNTRLDELFPGSVSPAKDHNNTHSGANLNVTIQVSEESSNRREAAMAARSDAIRSRILDTLWFRWLDDRRLTVEDAHAKTFSWVLDREVEKESLTHLPAWLQDGSGIYWLRGKAGSGKSTLMKFIHDDERTQEYLEVWAGKSELIISSFLFYAQGQNEQKSQVGLLRSLLHQILSRDTALTETVLPHAWREACRGRRKKHEDLSLPSASELVNALKEICQLYQTTRKMFLLIDGIDEYEGDDMDVAKFISDLGKLSNVKVLVSSRPHSAFFTAFSESPNMDLPSLTERDIASYVDDTIASHPNMRALYATNPTASESITKSLVEGASGVFLWVVLVCRSVIEGCDEHETSSDLQARVDESPKEVEDLLKYIIETIPPRWEDEAMNIMYLVHTNQHSNCVIPIFGLYLISEQGYSSDMHSSDIRAWGPYTTEETELKCKIMEEKLRSRCRGLIEVKRPSDRGINRHIWPDDEDQSGLYVRHCQVNFMHRTVYDLLSQQPIFDRHFGKIIQQGFNSYFVLCNLWCQLSATFHENPSCKSPGCKIPNCDSSECRFKPCLRVEFLNNAILILRYGSNQGCKPHIVLHCISRIQYVCGFFLHDEFHKFTRHFIHDMKCRDYYSDISVVLALAAEFALPDTIRLVYESNVPLHHHLYQPRSLESRESCQNGQMREMGSHECQQNHPYHKIKTEQGTLNIRSPLAFYYEVHRLGAIKFILENEKLDSSDTKTLLRKLDVFYNIGEEDCYQIHKDISLFIHSRLG